MQEFVDFIVATYAEFKWFFELGYVVVISTLLSMFLVWVIRKTIFKKYLANADSNKVDRVLGLTGTIVSILIYGAVYFASLMIIQRKFFIECDWHLVWISILSGGATTWAATKGLYTVLHKFIKRLKEKKDLKAALKESKADIEEVKKNVAKVASDNAANAQPKVIDSKIGTDKNKVKKIL